MCEGWKHGRFQTLGKKSLKIHLAWVGVAVVMLERLQLRVAEVRRHHVLRGHRHAEDAPGLGSAAAGGAAVAPADVVLPLVPLAALGGLLDGAAGQAVLKLHAWVFILGQHLVKNVAWFI